MRVRKAILFFLVLFILLLQTSCGAEVEEIKIEIVTPIEEVIEANKKEIFELINKRMFTDSTNLFVESITMTSVIQELYRSKKALWSDSTILNTTALNFLKIVRNANSYGLDSSLYNLTELNRLNDTLLKIPGNKSLLAKAEQEFSESCVTFLTHIKYGFINHDKLDSLYYQLKIDSLKGDDLKLIITSIENNELPAVIETLEPSFYEYKNLVNAWKQFLQNKTISSKRIKVESLKVDSFDTYEKAKEALILYGYLDTSIVKTDSGWIAVLKQFQSDHGLKEDGRIGSASAKALSRSNEDRWLSVVASLEKLKWKQRDPKSLFYANIPSYTLKIVEDNDIKRVYRTVVGRTINRTPEFDAKMTYLIVNPFWHIPNSISSKEILPKLRNDSTHASKKGYRILDKNRKVVDPKTINWNNVTQSSFNYRISQVRSGGTALGKVKFIFQNKHSIYFHDTPSKRLFKNDIRAYSHGCVRVQDPLDLAAYILHKQDSLMTLDSVLNLAKTGAQKRFDIDAEIKVNIAYHSAEGTPEGRIRLYRDIYRKESDLKKAIKNIVKDNQSKMNQ